MIYFLTVYIGSYIVSLFSIEKFKIVSCALIVFILSFLYLIRDYSVGIDTYNYIDIFNSIYALENFQDLIDYSVKDSIELGFSFFVKLLQLFSYQPYFAFYFFSLLIYCNILYVFYKYNLNLGFLVVSLITYSGIYFNTFNILRQEIAISFVILAVYFLLHKSSKLYIFFIIVGALFHYSAIVMLLILFFYKHIRYIYNNFIFFTFFSLIFITLVLKFLLSSDVLNSYLRYSKYLQSDEISSVLSPLYILFYTVIVFVLFLARKYINFKYYYNDFKLYALIFIIFYIYQMSLFFVGIVNQGLFRFSYYFLWAAIFALAIILKNVSNFYLRSILLMSSFIVFMIYLLYIYKDYPFSVNPLF